MKLKRPGLYKVFALLVGCVLVMYWAILYPVRTFPPAIESVRWTYVGRFRMADEIKNHMLDETDMKQFYDELQKLKLVRRGSSWEEMNSSHQVEYEVHSCYQLGNSENNFYWANFYIADDEFLLLSVSNQFVGNRFVLYEDVSGNFDEFLSLVQQLEEASREK